jgi:hypothetical protein
MSRQAAEAEMVAAAAKAEAVASERVEAARRLRIREERVAGRRTAAAKQAKAAAHKAAAAEAKQMAADAAAKAAVAEAERRRRTRVANTAAAAGVKRQHRWAQHRGVAHAAAEAARRRTIKQPPTFKSNDDEETIEEMVRRLERELDKEFEGFEAAATVNARLGAEEAPASRVSEAAAELEEVELENNNFHRSFVEVAEEAATKVKAAEAARTRVPEETPARAQMWKLEQRLPGKPPATNSNWKMEEATEQQSPGGSGKQKPPEMEWHRRPPRARDKSHIHQVQGCRQHLSVSGKGVLDIGYLASGRGPECRARYRFGAEARVREVPTRLARDRRIGDSNRRQ